MNDIKVNQDTVVVAPFKRSVFARLIGQLRVWRDRQLTIKQLRALPDHLLRDIGVERNLIVEFVDQRPANIGVLNIQSIKTAAHLKTQKAA